MDVAYRLIYTAAAMTEGSGMEARHVFYSGRVQGVGFRYIAQRIAQGYAVKGFVRNLADRRVELVVEGQAAEVEKLLAEISARMADNIRRADVQNVPVTGRYPAFEIEADA